jgi:uncharacterized DUF497 family protein
MVMYAYAESDEIRFISAREEIPQESRAYEEE